MLLVVWLTEYGVSDLGFRHHCSIVVLDFEGELDNELKERWKGGLESLDRILGIGPWTARDGGTTSSLWSILAHSVTELDRDAEAHGFAHALASSAHRYLKVP